MNNISEMPELMIEMLDNCPNYNLTYHEGLCVQCMHIGPYDNEPATIQAMREFAAKEGYEIDISDSRYHHEIYLSDARKVSPEKLKTVIRHPIRKVKAYE